MLPFSDRFPDRLQDTLELLYRANNPALDKLQLRYDSRLEFLQRNLIVIDMADSVRGVWMFTSKVVLARLWMEDGGEVVSKAGSVSEHV